MKAAFSTLCFLFFLVGFFAVLFAREGLSELPPLREFKDPTEEDNSEDNEPFEEDLTTETKVVHHSIKDDKEEILLQHDQLPDQHRHHHSHHQRCCFRASNLVVIGLDLEGKEHFVDIGACHRSCGHHKRNKSHHLQRRHLSSEAANDSLFLMELLQDMTHNLSTSHIRQECELGHHCEPKRIQVEHHHLREGPVDVEVIEGCHCVPIPPACRRMDNAVLYFEDSPYETEVDVGRCVGPCEEEGNQCRPTRNRTLNIEGPNGSNSIPVIEECDCSSSCYRMQHFDAFYLRNWTDSSNSTEDEVLEIDVGRCIGMCENTDPYQCVLRDSSDPEHCLMSLKRTPPKCIPVNFKLHSFESREEGQRRSIVSIEECGCN